MMKAIHKLIRSALSHVGVLLLGVTCVLFAPAALAQATSEPWVAPERASQKTSPVAADAGSIQSGRRLFERDCVKCHGASGHGDGPQAKFLSTPPGNLTSEAARKESDGALFWKMTEGRGRMPKSKMNETERWMVINYLRTLQKKS